MFTLTVQVPPPTIEPPEKEIDTLLAAGAKVGVPQPLVLALGVAATFIAPGEVGKVSLKATPVKAVEGFGLVIVKVSVEVPLGAIALGANAFVMEGGTTADTVREALAGLPVPAFVVLTPLLVLL
jgi:hypothetical protein